MNVSQYDFHCPRLLKGGDTSHRFCGCAARGVAVVSWLCMHVTMVSFEVLSCCMVWLLAALWTRAEVIWCEGSWVLRVGPGSFRTRVRRRDFDCTPSSVLSSMYSRPDVWRVAAGGPVVSPTAARQLGVFAIDEWPWQQTPDNAVAHMTTRGPARPAALCPHGLAAAQHAVEACPGLSGRLSLTTAM